ncbi:hypothetical protein DUT91_03525 [Phyllobacterium salinisoli]|uniref:Uncharacterized protein n=1 Tax=Phyllobacterium salinisoli TaxID=1899321 RepID=A0A368K9C2_9HYPH|nr:hypothetical protein [Phyllobacterium salinisoli]RCS25841.1 hypothetical protein DUT91_03525 [Phyllobacterium salinisoli]
MRDLYSNIGVVQALAPAVQTAAGDGVVIDLLGYNRVAFMLNTGVVAGDGDFGVKVQESDTSISGDFTDASAAVIDTNASATLAASSAYKLGYRGYKRYVRLVLTKTGGTSIVAGAVAILGDAASRPVD